LPHSQTVLPSKVREETEKEARLGMQRKLKGISSPGFPALCSPASEVRSKKLGMKLDKIQNGRLNTWES